MVKSPGGELSSAFGTSKDGGDSWVKNTGGLARLFGVWVTIGKIIFWGSSKKLIRTIVRA